MVVGRGASDPDANSNVAKVTRMLWEGMGFGWAETAYSGVTFPLVEPGLEHAAKLGYRRIVVFPYFLFTGILVKRIYEHTDRVAARHPGIELVQEPYLHDHPPWGGGAYRGRVRTGGLSRRPPGGLRRLGRPGAGFP